MGGAKCQYQPEAMRCICCEISLNTKLLFTLFNKVNADSLLYYTSGNTQYSLHVHSPFCIATVAQIESEVMSPMALVYEGCCRASRFRPSVVEMSSSMSWQNINEVQAHLGNAGIILSRLKHH